jgi:uncharacterized protein YecE (DUF72 family)
MAGEPAAPIAPMRKLTTTPGTHEVRIGTAGWAIPQPDRVQFPAERSQLARYASRLSTVEINSSFRRDHRRSTYERWGSEVPASFRFCVKLPRSITHEQRLVDSEAMLDAFLAGATGLGERLGCLLVQLPPKLAFAQSVSSFLEGLRQRFPRQIAVEPRRAAGAGSPTTACMVHRGCTTRPTMQ